MDRGAWQATIHGVTKNWTLLSNTHTHTHTHTQSKDRGWLPAKETHLVIRGWELSPTPGPPRKRE